MYTCTNGINVVLPIELPSVILVIIMWTKTNSHNSIREMNHDNIRLSISIEIG